MNLNINRAMMEMPKNRINTNSYATKKTIAQGMFDVALLTSNASQLKRCLTMKEKNQFYVLLLVLIGLSVFLQIVAGVLFFYIGYHDLEEPERQKRLNKLNNVTTIIVFFITVINVFISGFGMNDSNY